LSASRHFNRRESFALAAWAFVGAGCDGPATDLPSGGGGDAAPKIEPPKLGEGLADPLARQFYARRGGKPAWTAAQGEDLTHSFADARRHGLRPAAFAIKQTPGEDLDQQDIALTLAALRYARALAFGFVHPLDIEKVFTLERNQVDLAAGLQEALDKGDLTGWLASLAPSDPEYQALSDAYLAAVGGAGAPSVARCQSPPDQSPADKSPADKSPPDQSPLDQSASDKGAPQQNAPAQGAPTPGGPDKGAPDKSAPDQGAPAQSAPDQNTPAQGAPAQAPSGQSQRPPDEGAQHAPAKAAPTGASVPRSDRARQLAANLERRRWISRTPPATRIDVNTASCALVYVRPGTDPWATRTVCGKPGHGTPSIQGSFRRLVANPPWRVPMDIARKEIFPKGRGYMRREHMRVVAGQVVQQPGPHNSLGLVKFDVLDPYAIYLHDTPSKSLFALPERHKSHGCVRVQNALGFARLLADQANKTDDFDKALASGKTREVDIGETIPVRLLYHTAVADESGRITFVPDVYGWNDKLATALGWGPPRTGARSEEPDVDVGP
jgi:murein L,D-transpeptidase YcbB/YkuD